MKIFNCFPFFNELDLLEIRLAELYDLVDRFVIVECSETFSGHPKPMLLKENMARFARYADKIMRVEITSSPPGITDWEREFFQFDQSLIALTDAAPDDLIMATDADEIPSAATLREIRANPPKRGQVYCLGLRWFNYFVNLERNERWIRGAPRVGRRADIPSIRQFRLVRGPAETPMRNLMRGIKASIAMRRPIRRKLLPDAGWHFSWLGGADAVALKARAIPQHGWMPDSFGSVETASEMIRNATSLQSGDFVLRSIGPDFPRLLQEEPGRFAHIILDPAAGG